MDQDAKGKSGMRACLKERNSSPEEERKKGREVMTIVSQQLDHP
jgi:hypothetical protein